MQTRKKLPMSERKALGAQVAAGAVDAATVAEQTGYSVQTVQRWAQSAGNDARSDATAEPNLPIAAGAICAPDQRRMALHDRVRYVFTAAQNNTLVHRGFFDALQVLCRVYDAQLVVGTFTYNKSGFQNGTKDDDGLWYDPCLTPYILDHSAEVTPDLVWCGELDILPTAVHPLTGLGNYTRHASGIVPHAKIAMNSIPTQPGGFKAMYTTGCITQRNYIQRRTGQIAEFHHVHGALLVEVDRSSGQWWARQLSATQDGSFYDLTNRFYPGGYERNIPALAITWGDVHAEKCPHAEWIFSAQSPGNMLDVLRPQYQFMHDLLDFMSRNHHNRNSGHFLSSMQYRTVADDLRAVQQVLWLAWRECTKTVVVESNHDQAIVRWLDDPSGHKDPLNSRLWHTLNAKLQDGLSGSMLCTALRTVGNIPDDSVFLQEDQSFRIGEDDGIECGMHGHRGPNGRRGSPAAFRDLGVRVNIGHTHSAGITGGVYCAGVSGSLDMQYNRGPSSWSHSHIVTYNNSKRCIVRMQGDTFRWRLEDGRT